MTRFLLLSSLLFGLVASPARADDTKRTSFTIGAAVSFQRAPRLTEGSSVTPDDCDWLCFRSIDRYLGLIERGGHLRLELRQRRSRVAGLRLTGWLGGTSGTWAELAFESGLLSIGAGERLDRRNLQTTGMVDAGLAFGPVLFAKRTSFSPAFAWRGGWRVDGSDRTAEEPEGYALPKRVHVLGVDLNVTQHVSDRASLFVSIRVGVPTGRGCPECLSYGVSLGAAVDALGDE